MSTNRACAIAVGVWVLFCAAANLVAGDRGGVMTPANEDWWSTCYKTNSCRNGASDCPAGSSGVCRRCTKAKPTGTCSWVGATRNCWWITEIRAANSKACGRMVIGTCRRGSCMSPMQGAQMPATGECRNEFCNDLGGNSHG